MNYHNKQFRSVNNTDNGEVSSETLFRYQQSGDIITASYEGGQIKQGNLIGKVNAQGQIEMRYQHLNQQMEFMTGRCVSTPEVLPNGKIRLHEKWQWTSGDCSEGESIIEEV
ncbi:n-acetylglutamate synthase [uncultured Microscilla sp.]|uniref:n-acetylglutamate synthase n=1 Tax=uncultured Microscilla sp. TaxID=432653 RepID=UPI00260F7D34|nr:n-acetylglutamate synthase [uncultured Microscilla sp.]